MWLFFPEFPPLGGRKMKRSRTEAAETRQRLVRAAADRFQREGIDAGRRPMKWNALAEQSSSLCKAMSVIGDRWTILILHQCFLKFSRYGEIQSSLGLSKPLLAARLKKMVRLGMLGAFAEVGAGSRISPDRERPPALSRPAGPCAMGKCLSRRGGPARDNAQELHYGRRI